MLMVKKVIEVFRTREELDKLVNLPNKKYRSGIRNRAILAILCYAGLRVSELLSLKISDIKNKDYSIRVNNAKKKSSRMVYVPEYLFHYIEKWKEIRPDSRYLFCSRYGKKLLPDYIQKMVKRYSKKIDSHKDIHPHCLRHSVATIWLKEGKPVRGIQKQLGHKSLVTTQIYLDYFDEDRKKDFSNIELLENVDSAKSMRYILDEIAMLKKSMELKV